MILVSIIVVVVIVLLVIMYLKTHKQRYYDSSKVHQFQNVNVVLDPKTREDEKEKEPMTLYAVPDKKKKASNHVYGAPEKSSKLVEKHLDFKELEEQDVGMLYAVPDKKKKAPNKAPGVPDKSSELVDFKEEGIVSSGMNVLECNQTDSDAQRSRPSPAQQEPINVDMLYAIPDKKKKKVNVSK